MDREKVEKGLDCCRAVSFRRCYECPYREFEPNPAQCTMVLSKQAHALIREITEEKESVKADTVRKMQDRLEKMIAYFPDGFRYWACGEFRKIAHEVVNDYESAPADYSAKADALSDRHTKFATYFEEIMEEE